MKKMEIGKISATLGEDKVVKKIYNLNDWISEKGYRLHMLKTLLQEGAKVFTCDFNKSTITGK